MFLYLIILVTLITLCHQLAHMLKFLDTLIKFIIIIIIIIITTFVSFPSFMAGTPEAANHENDVKPTAEEKLNFDDDTLRGERQNNFPSPVLSGSI